MMLRLFAKPRIGPWPRRVERLSCCDLPGGPRAAWRRRSTPRSATLFSRLGLFLFDQLQDIARPRIALRIGARRIAGAAIGSAGIGPGPAENPHHRYFTWLEREDERG